MEMEICKQQSENEMPHIPAISMYGYVGVKVGVENFVFGSIDRYCLD